MSQAEPEEVNPARLRALGQLQATEEAIRFHTHRQAQIESKLLDVQKAEEQTKYPKPGHSRTYGWVERILEHPVPELQHSASEFMRLIRYYLKLAGRDGYPPWRLETIQRIDPMLFGIVKEVIG